MGVYTYLRYCTKCNWEKYGVRDGDCPICGSKCMTLRECDEEPDYEPRERTVYEYEGDNYEEYE